MLGLPKKAVGPSVGGFFAAAVASAGGAAAGEAGAGRPKRTPAWLKLDESGRLHWASLEQRQGRPLEEGDIAPSEVLGVRNTGMVLELPLKGFTQPATLEFGTAAERETWARYLEIAVEVLTPESERSERDAERASHRQHELEERRSLNEERKKRLQEGLGMKFTAEAMMNREQR